MHCIALNHLGETSLHLPSYFNGLLHKNTDILFVFETPKFFK